MAEDPQRTPEGDAATTRAPRRRTDAPPLAIADPRALKALAHPARQRVLDLLHDHDAPITATQAAAECGLSPSAMSYHLRALERWGIVERDETSTDGRERPWRAVGSSISVGPQALGGVAVAEVSAYLAAFLAPLNEAATRMTTSLSQRPPDAPDHLHGFMSRGRMWLTPSEFAEVQQTLMDLVDRYADRSVEEHPPQARPYDSYRILLPLDLDPAGAPADTSADSPAR